MRQSLGCTAAGCAAVVFSALFCVDVGVAAAQQDLAGQAAVLVRQLDDPSAANRDQAEQQLVELAGSDNASTEAVLAALPTANDRMPQEVRLRLERIRRKIEGRFAAAAAAAGRVTLSVEEAPLSEVLAEFEKQTGNRVVDYRDQFGQANEEKTVTLEVDDAEYWPTMDQLLDSVNMTTYAFSGSDALAIVNRTGGALRRYGRAEYAGPFRLEAVSIESRRGIRNPDQSGLQLALEVSWEPRLKPIALSQPADQVQALCDDGRTLPAATQMAVVDIEVQSGSHASEFVLPLQLPAREAAKITSLKGRLEALAPGREAEFQFDNLAELAQPATEPATKQIADVAVTVDRVRKNNVLWEVHMRIRVDSAEAGLESHRGWVFQNLTYMLDAEGNVIDHVGFETTMQTEREVGMAYLFELEGDVGQYTWVYKSPAAIMSVPVEYELTDIPLP